MKFKIFISKDCDIRLWHVENCDNIKQVMEQNKTLKNTKVVSVSFEYSFVFISLLKFLKF